MKISPSSHLDHVPQDNAMAMDPHDHRLEGHKHDLFFLHPDAPGQVFWKPKGWALFQRLQDLVRHAHKDEGAEEIQSPDRLSQDLWIRSGHESRFGDMMLPAADGLRFKPMNCPGHILVWEHKPRHIQHLPLRLAELGRVHRNEPSGALKGLLRLRAFTQDDGHIFCLPHHIQNEVARLLGIAQKVYRALGFEQIDIALSTKPDNALGSDEEWAQAEHALENALVQHNLPWRRLDGEGAFYGPKIEIGLTDRRGRVWQCGTIQLDFQLPKQFNLKALDNQGQGHRPVLIHRAILGSLERFLGILLEHHANAWPLWMFPKDIALIALKPEDIPAVEDLAHNLQNAGWNVILDRQTDVTLGGRVQQALEQGSGHIGLVGPKEREHNVVALRTAHNKKTTSVPMHSLSAHLLSVCRPWKQP